MTSEEFHSPLIFGEVLFDRFPDGNQVLGGAPFNVAWNLQALGLRPRFVSRVGDDELGKRILDAMAEWHLDQTGVQIDTERPTGTVEVSLRDGEPSFAIAGQRAYDFVAPAGLPPATASSLIYHGSLALRGATTRKTFAGWVAGSSASLFMDVNLRAPFWERDQVLRLARGARWVKLNQDELELLVPGSNDPAERAHQVLAESGLEALVVTRGEAGASLYTGGGDNLHPRPVAATRVRDTVGAGDAFSSVVILGLAHGWPWPRILERALEFAAAVVGLQGATTRDRDFYRNFKTQWELS